MDDKNTEVTDKNTGVENESTGMEIESTWLKENRSLEKVYTKKLLLEHQMTTSGSQTFHGKICLYCMGVYEGSAFELDHIKPVSGHRNVMSAEIYNDVVNVIAVCKTYNTSTKGAEPLTDIFYLKGRVR